LVYATSESSPSVSVSFPTSLAVGAIVSTGIPYVAVASQSGSQVLFGPLGAFNTVDLDPTTPAAVPLAVAYGDFSGNKDSNGNPILDEAVAESTGNGGYQVAIYQG